MTREVVVALLRERDALAAAGGAALREPVTVVRSGDPETWLVDDHIEGTIDAHRQAHLAGRPSVATIRYGEGVSAEATADRILALAALARETGLLRAVCPVPADGVRTPGSWGVEDLTVVAVARRTLDPSVHVRPSWDRLGPQTCGVTLAFGADELLVPTDAPVDPAHLAAAVGREVVER